MSVRFQIGYANAVNNVFRINKGFNNYKSRVAIDDYVGDPYIHEYLCSDFTQNTTLVWEVVQTALDNIIADKDPTVSAVGAQLANALGLNNLRC
jgi:hypothetical protein